MRLVRLQELVLFLCVVLILILILNSFLPSSSPQTFRFVFHPIFVFSVFNIIIFAIVVGSQHSSAEEVDRVLNYLCPPYEPENDKHDETQEENADTFISSEGNNDEADDDDDDENGRGWHMEDEYDVNLEKKIEDFIDKVNERWREEKLTDNLSNQLQVVVSALCII